MSQGGGRGEESVAGRGGWVARGERAEALPWPAQPAIGRHLLSRSEAGEERGAANEYCGLAAETAAGLFIERQPASP